jgi:hypothetical protein
MTFPVDDAGTNRQPKSADGARKPEYSTGVALIMLAASGFSLDLATFLRLVCGRVPLAPHPRRESDDEVRTCGHN